MLCDVPWKIVLVLVNIVTLLIGIALMAIGGIMVWGQDVVHNLLEHVLTPLIQQIHPSSENISLLVKTILTATAPVGYAVLIVGAVIAGVSLLAYIGACCSKIFLYIYAAIMGVLAAAVMVIFILYFVKRDAITDGPANWYAKSVRHYDSLKVNNVYSLAVLLVQGPLQCCGDIDYRDFVSKNSTDQYGGKNYTNLKAPVPCCKMNDEYVITDNSCPGIFTDANSNWRTGCRAALKDLLARDINKFAYALIGLFVGLLLLVVFSVLAAACC